LDQSNETKTYCKGTSKIKAIASKGFNFSYFFPARWYFPPLNYKGSFKIQQ
jgi:hypothetical protein